MPDEALEELANGMKEYKRQATKNDSKVISNGISIFSQFLAHDITFESSSAQGAVQSGKSFSKRYEADGKVWHDLQRNTLL